MMARVRYLDINQLVHVSNLLGPKKQGLFSKINFSQLKFLYLFCELTKIRPNFRK